MSTRPLGNPTMQGKKIGAGQKPLEPEEGTSPQTEIDTNPQGGEETQGDQVESKGTEDKKPQEGPCLVKVQSTTQTGDTQGPPTILEGTTTLRARIETEKQTGTLSEMERTGRITITRG